MKKTLIATLFASTSVLGAAAFAHLVPEQFGTKSNQLEERAVVDSALLQFEKIDVDESGTIDVEEFAAQAVVYAELARLNGVVTVDSLEAVRHVPLPKDSTAQMSLAERTRIDAQARAEFFMVADGEGPLDQAQWVAARLATFDAADADRDGDLDQAELITYASLIARLPSMSSNS